MEVSTSGNKRTKLINTKVIKGLSNNSDDNGKELKFRIWDNDECRELWNIELQSAVAIYSDNSQMGSPTSQVQAVQFL